MDGEIADLVDELVALVEQREAADPDGYDWTVDRRIREVEQDLVVLHRLNARDPGETISVRPGALAGSI